MFERKLDNRNAFITTIAAVSILSLASCAKKGADTVTATKQGTVNVEELKVGLPEKTFKDANITFVLDNSPAASTGGKTQYWSRVPNKKGGKVIAECKDDKCFVLQVSYKDNPVLKDEALETLKQLLPADAPPQSKVSAQKPIEIYEFGDKYTGIIQADADGTRSILVSAIARSPDQVRAAMAGKPIDTKGTSKEAAGASSDAPTKASDTK